MLSTARLLDEKDVQLSQYHSYSPGEPHGLAFNPFKALISPRPIGWFTTVSASGDVNLAPYSFFNAFSDEPPIIGFSSAGWKHTVRNISETGDFVHNVVPARLSAQMNQTSAPLPAGQNEAAKAGLATIDSDIVRAPRLADGAAALECKLVEIQTLKTADGETLDRYLVLGEVVRVHIDTALITEGKVDQVNLSAVARLGYRDYAQVERIFEMTRPEGA